MKGNSGKVTSEEGGGDDANKEIPAGHNSAQGPGTPSGDDSQTKRITFPI